MNRGILGFPSRVLPAALLTGWFQDNVAASQSAVALAMGNTHTEAPMPRPGQVVGVVVSSNDARTAGTLTVAVTVNGTPTRVTARLDGTNPIVATSTESHPFSAGQRVGVKITTDSGWLPTTADIDVAVLVTL